MGNFDLELQFLPAPLVVAREGGASCHVTSAKIPREVKLRKGVLSFTLDDLNWDHCRAIVAGMPANVAVKVDGKPLSQSDELEKPDEGWSRGPLDLTLIKVRRTGKPRTLSFRTQ